MTIILNVSAEIETRFTEAAHNKSIEPSKLFEQMVESCLSESEQNRNDSRSLYERFSEVIGTVEGLPPDMSENPHKYMTGFGETRNSTIST